MTIFIREKMFMECVTSLTVGILEARSKGVLISKLGPADSSNFHDNLQHGFAPWEANVMRSSDGFQ